MDAKTKTEIERKVAAGIPLAGDEKGNVSSANLAYYQQLLTAQQAANTANQSNQSTGGGVGSSGGGVYGGNTVYPASNVVPDNVSAAVKGYGFTAVIGLGVALLVFSLASSFRRVRGKS